MLGDPMTEAFESNKYGIEDEMSYWRSIFEKHRKVPDQHISALLSDKSPLQSDFENILLGYINTDQSHIRVLDVGCGPLSVLGKSGRFSLEIVGIDPLADMYAELLAEQELIAPHKAINCLGENILDKFPPNSFDFVHSRNALDHCEDARVVIRNMIEVAKPGSKVFFNVCQNEAENAAYSGFHRWNFDEVAGRLFVWNPGSADLLDRIIDGLPYVYTRSFFRSDKSFKDQFDVIIHKNTDLMVKGKEVTPGVRACYSRRHGWVTIEADSPLDQAIALFVQGFVDNEMKYNSSHRWYKNDYRRSVRVTPNTYSHVVIGQYYRDFSAETVAYVNPWKCTLESID
jgi:SAM-dependent methyltransferase